MIQSSHRDSVKYNWFFFSNEEFWHHLMFQSAGGDIHQRISDFVGKSMSGTEVQEGERFLVDWNHGRTQQKFSIHRVGPSVGEFKWWGPHRAKSTSGESQICWVKCRIFCGQSMIRSNPAFFGAAMYSLDDQPLATESSLSVAQHGSDPVCNQVMIGVACRQRAGATTRSRIWIAEANHVLDLRRYYTVPSGKLT